MVIKVMMQVKTSFKFISTIITQLDRTIHHAVIYKVVFTSIDLSHFKNTDAYQIRRRQKSNMRLLSWQMTSNH